MPSMANITVLDAAGANVVYTAAAPSAGDSVPARWRNNSASAVMSFRPDFQLLFRDNSRRNGRAFRAFLRHPITGLDPNGTLIKVAEVPLELSGVLPTNVDAAKVFDAYVQFGNLLVSALVRSSFSEGFAPT